MKKTILLTAILIFGLTGVGRAQFGCPLAGGGVWPCQGAPPKGGAEMPRGRWWLMPQVVEKYEITRDEQNRLNSLYVDNRRILVDLKSNLEKALLALEIELDKPEFSEKTCMMAFKKVQEARTALSLEGFRYIIEIRTIFGQERFLELRERFREFRGNLLMQRRPPGTGPGGVNPSGAPRRR